MGLVERVCQRCGKHFMYRYDRPGKYCSIKCSQILEWGEKNPAWVGDRVSYSALHTWAKKRMKRPENCQDCGVKNNKLDLANISGKYKRDLADFKYICRRCHMKEDGRMAKLTNINRRKKKCLTLNAGNATTKI